MQGNFVLSFKSPKARLALVENGRRCHPEEPGDKGSLHLLDFSNAEMLRYAQHDMNQSVFSAPCQNKFAVDANGRRWTSCRSFMAHQRRASKIRKYPEI